MKKIVLCCLALVCLLMTSCSSDWLRAGRTYACYIYGSTNGEIIGSSERTFWPGSYFHSDNAEESKTVQDGDSERTMTYKWSWYKLGTTEQIDTYHCQDNDTDYYFSNATGQLRGVHRSDVVRQYTKKESPVFLTEEELYEEADAFAAQHINIDVYHREVLRDSYLAGSPLYDIRFRYVKEVCGFETREFFDVVYTSEGDMISYHECGFGLFDDESVVSLDKEKADLTIKEKLDTLVGRDRYEIRDQTLGYTLDGKLCILTNAVANLGETTTCVDLVTIIE